MSFTDDISDIEIPEIEISPGWAVSDVTDIEECNDAYAFLMAAVAQIEFEIELYEIGESRFKDPTWPARARRALKYKKAALQLVGWKRGEINDGIKRVNHNDVNRRLLEYIKTAVPEATFKSWLDAVIVPAKEAA